MSRDREHMADIARKGSRRGGAARGGQSRSKDGGEQSATDLLRADHEKVKGLFHDYETADEENTETRNSIAQKTFMELEIHSKIEEEIFYPAVREQAGEQAGELVDEAVSEHGAVKELIEELRSMSPDDEGYDDRFQDLIDNVLHHAEEEESEMLPLAEEQMGDSLQSLGAEMASRKQQLMSSTQAK